MKEIFFLTHSKEETLQLGQSIGQIVPPDFIIGLIGELGSGKTCLIKGIAKGMGQEPQYVTSPTFTIINEYSGSKIPLFHFDFYRLKGLEDFHSIGFEDYLNHHAVLVMEWVDHIKKNFHCDLNIFITIENHDQRKFKIVSHSAKGQEVLEKMGDNFLC